jgi:hypothetical protein
MSDWIMPPSWLADVYANMLDRMVIDSTGPQRAGHRLPVTDAQQAAYETWLAEYERIRDAGYENGWLSGGFEGEEVVEPSGEWVWDEPEADYNARKREWLQTIAPSGTVTIPIIYKPATYPPEQKNSN